MLKDTYDQIRDEAYKQYNNSSKIYEKDPINLPFFKHRENQQKQFQEQNRIYNLVNNKFKKNIEQTRINEGEILHQQHQPKQRKSIQDAGIQLIQSKYILTNPINNITKVIDPKQIAEFSYKMQNEDYGLLRNYQSNNQYFKKAHNSLPENIQTDYDNFQRDLITKNKLQHLKQSSIHDAHSNSNIKRQFSNQHSQMFSPDQNIYGHHQSPQNYRSFNPILFELSDKSNSPVNKKYEEKQQYLDQLKLAYLEQNLIQVREITHNEVNMNGRREYLQKINNDLLAKNSLKEPLYAYQKLDYDVRFKFDETLKKIKQRRMQALVDREIHRKSGDLVESNQVREILQNDPLILFRKQRKSQEKAVNFENQEELEGKEPQRSIRQKTKEEKQKKIRNGLSPEQRQQENEDFRHYFLNYSSNKSKYKQIQTKKGFLSLKQTQGQLLPQINTNDHKVENQNVQTQKNQKGNQLLSVKTGANIEQLLSPNLSIRKQAFEPIQQDSFKLNRNSPSSNQRQEYKKDLHHQISQTRINNQNF